MLQVSKLYSLKKVDLLPKAIVWFKAAVFMAVTFYIVYSLQKAGIGAKSFKMILLQAQLSWLVWLVIVLMPVNWALEACKWKYLLQNIEQVSFTEAFAGVLSGLCFGFITPQGIGDYAGRVIRLRSSSKYPSLSALLVSNFAQFYVTLVGGSCSVTFLLMYLQRPGAGIIALLLLVLNAGLLLTFLHIQKALAFLVKFSLFKQLNRYLSITYTVKEVGYTLCLALIRYLTFSCQFVAMLYFLEVALPLHLLFLGVGFVFLAKSVLPVLNSIGDLGIREATALFFFGFFEVDPEKVLTASLLIWLINIIVPSVAGVGVVMATKIKEKCWS